MIAMNTSRSSGKMKGVWTSLSMWNDCTVGFVRLYKDYMKDDVCV
jgi:hypothetical protein